MTPEQSSRDSILAGSPYSAAGSFTEPLLALLAEVNLLSIRLKQVGRRGRQKDALPTAARNLLRVLEQFGPMTVPQIARLGSSSRQNIQVLANRLESKGCIQLVPNPAHRRSGLLQLTESGRQKLVGMRGTEDQVLAQLRANLAESEIASALAIVQRMRELLTANLAGEANSSSRGPKATEGRAASRAAAEPRTNPTVEAEETKPKEDMIAGVDLPVNLL